MPAKDLGTKHTCFKCGTRFYDLRKPEPICPKCGADQRQVPASKPSAAAEKRRAAASRPAPPPKPEVEDLEVEPEVEEDLEGEEEGEEPGDTDEL